MGDHTENGHSDSPGEVRRVAFEELYGRYAKEIWALAYSRRLNSHTATELMQEAFLRLWREWDTGKTHTNPRGWLQRVVRNLAEDDAKSAFRRNRTVPNDQLADVGIRGESSPLDDLIRQERSVQVRLLLEELAAADREALTLRYALERSVAEIAETLGISENAVQMRLSRARDRLAVLLTQKGV